MGLEQISNVNEAAQVEMNKRKNLRSLRFHFNRLEGGDVGRMKGVLESFEPHENLEGLDITDYYLGSQFPCWMENISLLSNIVNMKLDGCSQCTELPALGKLASLERLEIWRLSSVKRVGLEFLGISDDERGSLQEQLVVFPKLRLLHFFFMEEWEEWNLPFQMERMIIMPNLCSLQLHFCHKLRALQDIEKLKSLETLRLWELNSMEELGEEIIPNKKDELRGDFKPCLRLLDIGNCPKLKVISRYMFPHTLRDLSIQNCPDLMEMQHFLPPLMQYLALAGDAGVFSKSLHVNNKCSVGSVIISLSPHSSLPKGFNQLEAVRRLSFYLCESLDFEQKEWEHLTTLQCLSIYKCPLLKERFEQGDDWRSILSHVAKIEIDDIEITKK